MRRFHLRLGSVVLLAALIPWLNGCQPSNPPQPAQNESPIEPALVFQPVPEPPAPSAEDSDVDSDAAVIALSADKPLPTNINLTDALAEALQLADSGVEENVLLSFITNAIGPFNLGPDEIIFLSDIGLSTPVVAAMLEHDRLLKEAAANALAAVPTFDTTMPPEPEPDPAFNAPTYVTWPEPADSYDSAMPISYTEPYPPPQVSADSAAYFHDALAPYGDWIDVEGYGRCWQPSVVVIHKNWRPYCDRGRWAYTDCGWYWVSDYSWGWAPFHYGRWFRHGRVGWCWAPDRVWGPAWVSWRYSNEYCGWAPLPPRARFTGAGFTYNGRAVGSDCDFGLRPDCYAFVPYQRFQDRDVSRHAVAQTSVDRFIDKTTVSNRILRGRQNMMNLGLPREQVATITRREVRKATIREMTPDSIQVNRPEELDADGHTLSIVRPNWRPPTRRPAPATDIRQASATPVEAGAQPAWLQTRPQPGPASPRSPGGVAPAQAQVAPVPVEAPRLATAAHTTTPDVVAPATAAMPATSRGWERPRRITVPRSTLVQPQTTPIGSAPTLPAARLQTERSSSWRPAVVHHSEAQQQVVRTAPEASWQTPAQVPMRASQVAAAQRAAAQIPVQVAPPVQVQESPRWERPRQEYHAPEAVRAPEPRDNGWQAPQRSHERVAAPAPAPPPAPAPAPRAESSSRSAAREENSGGRQRR